MIGNNTVVNLVVSCQEWRVGDGEAVRPVVYMWTKGVSCLPESLREQNGRKVSRGSEWSRAVVRMEKELTEKVFGIHTVECWLQAKHWS